MHLIRGSACSPSSCQWIVPVGTKVSAGMRQLALLQSKVLRDLPNIVLKARQGITNLRPLALVTSWSAAVSRCHVAKPCFAHVQGGKTRS